MKWKRFKHWASAYTIMGGDQVLRQKLKMEDSLSITQMVGEKKNWNLQAFRQENRLKKLKTNSTNYVEN